MMYYPQNIAYRHFYLQYVFLPILFDGAGSQWQSTSLIVGLPLTTLQTLFKESYKLMVFKFKHIN